MNEDRQVLKQRAIAELEASMMERYPRAVVNCYSTSYCFNGGRITVTLFPISWLQDFNKNAEGKGTEVGDIYWNYVFTCNQLLLELLESEEENEDYHANS